MHDDDKQEIVIIRRYGGDDDGHHGGAWKIAFADFMTAMMALFLVLWLVNAANEETKKSVASYFNPVKLVERNRSSRGLEEQSSPVSQKADDDDESPSEASASEQQMEASEAKDAALFKDPFQVLNQIADKAKEEIEQAALIAEDIRTTGSPSEDAFLDPFAQAVPQTQESELEPEGNFVPERKVDSTGPKPSLETTASVAPKKQDSEQISSNEGVAIKKANISETRTDTGEKMKAAVAGVNEKTKAAKERAERLEELSKTISSEIRNSLKEALGPNEEISESLSVTNTEDGVLISITDQFGFSMFQLGSALPKGKLVLAMTEVSRILSKQKGAIRIYGHTDARPYNAGEYDNWRLSTARAHAARLMLGRGNLKAERISRVVGFADKNLKDPDEPESEVNRRIEILLEVQ